MPVTMRQYEANLRQPAFCELLPIRDYLDNVIVRSNGALVAGYDLGGINSYYHSDETRNQTKCSLEALVRSLTERSTRMQVATATYNKNDGDGARKVRARQRMASRQWLLPSAESIVLVATEGRQSRWGSYHVLRQPGYLLWRRGAAIIF